MKTLVSKTVIVLALCLQAISMSGQELFVFTEPASNMPAKSISVKLSAESGHTRFSQVIQRYSPEVMWGASRKFMIHAGGSFSNLPSSPLRPESFYVYGKYRFLSSDEVHEHFRMAAFLMASFHKIGMRTNEISLPYDQGGVYAGVIATKLVNRLAISGSAGLQEVLDEQRWLKIYPKENSFEAITYTFSAGYLLFPKNYVSYHQPSLNLYLELLGSKNIHWSGETFFLDIAPSVQLILNSRSKINLGRRLQVAGNIERLMKNRWVVGYELIFLR
jgi:hypothetical protein